MAFSGGSFHGAFSFGARLRIVGFWCRLGGVCVGENVLRGSDSGEETAGKTGRREGIVIGFG